MSTGPLHGRTILDCSTLLPGPFLGKLLVLKGARVIKVESPSRPDPARQWPIYYQDVNSQKEIVALDLKNADNQAEFKKLVAQADGLIEGFRPAAKLRLGLDETSLHVVNPKLCIVSLVGYPEAGAWKDRPGHDMNFAAVTGLMSLFNEMPGIPLADLFGAYEGALSLCAAMDAVARGGNGRRISVSLSDVLFGIQSRYLTEYKETGKLPVHGQTLFSGLYPCYHMYSAKDGRRITVGAIEEKFWVEVCTRIGLPELATKGYQTGTEGKDVIQRVAATFAARPWKGHWDQVFVDGACCVEPVLDYSEIERGL